MLLGTEHRMGHATSCARRCAGGIAALALMALVAGCRATPSTVATSESLGAVVANPIVQTSTDEIAGNATRFVGRVVTVNAQVTRVFGPRWFAIGSGAPGARDLLVLGSQDVPALVGAGFDSARAIGTRVRVTGVVRAYEEDALEREVGGGLDLDGDMFDPFDATPIIVLTNLHVEGSMGGMAGGAAAMRRVDTVTVDRRFTPAMIVTERTLTTTSNLATLAGRPVTLMGVRVHEVFGPNAFTVHLRNLTGTGAAAGQQPMMGQQGDSLLLVVFEQDATRGTSLMRGAGAQPRAGAGAGAEGTSNVRAGQNVAIVGVLQSTSDDQTGWRSRAALTSQNEATLGNQQVFLAASRVELLANPQSGTRRGQTPRP